MNYSYSPPPKYGHYQSISPTADQGLRQFRVSRRAIGSEVVVAESVQVNPAGALIFMTQGKLIIAYSPAAWTTIEEDS